VGLFRTEGDSEINELFTWPSSPRLLAIARGYAHYIDVRNPQARTKRPIFPVRHALRHPSGLVVLGGFDHLCGLDGDGLKWESSRLASDWIDKLRLEGDFVLGNGNVPSTGGWLPFTVSVLDGTTQTEWRSGF
jgi:hypothetical protein